VSEKLEVPIDVAEVLQTFEYVKGNYKRRHTVTLAPTDDNFIRALEVWKYGVEHHKGIVSAVIAVYGYRYRRMENFIRECQLWMERKGWLHSKVLTKLYQEYISSRDNSIRIELYLYHYLPEFLIGNHDLQRCESFFNECVERIPDWSWGLYVGGEFKVGDDVKLKEHGYVYCCTQNVDIEMTFWKFKGGAWKIYDRAEFDATLANYVLYHLKLCPEVEDWAIHA